MAQYRQSGGIHNHPFPNRLASDHVSIAVPGAASRHLLHHRRSKPLPPYPFRILITFWLLAPILILSFSAFLYFSLLSQTKGGETNRPRAQDDDMGEIGIDTDFLTNVTLTQKSKELKFGHESVVHDQDSHYWNGDDRRRDDDYTEDKLEQPQDNSVDKVHNTVDIRNNKSSFDVSHENMSHQYQGNGLYNEAGRNELKLYEAEHEATLKDVGTSTDLHDEVNQQSGDNYRRNYRTLEDADEYDDGMNLRDDPVEDYGDAGHGERGHTGATIEIGKYSHRYPFGNKSKDNINEAYKASDNLYGKDSASETQHSKGHTSKGYMSTDDNLPAPKLISEKHAGSKKKSKRRKFSGTCEMKTMNSTAQLVEPVESRKFVRFSLQYTEKEEKPIVDEGWEARFAGHQSLKEREESFLARDQKINCGFVKGPAESPSTGFDIAEDDAKYLSSCHIAVMSCIFGNSDRLRSPHGRMVTRFSRKNVCFVMFVDEATFETLSSEGQMPDMMGFLGLWKMVVVKNLPYNDMRRVGKIPKLLAHRLFSSARYSIWLDSKLRLQLDPLVILEYFLWRKGYEYAISNHYDRHCLWDEVEQNKKLNKYNHSVIDEQFAFYQADGMRRFNPSDPNKLLPSNVPEGSVIVRAHTPMSNLFSCLWFNEVDRFTPRDQLSFAYTYHKLRWMNPEKPFYLHMFKDCERRRIAKLYHHRTDEKKRNSQSK